MRKNVALVLLLWMGGVVWGQSMQDNCPPMQYPELSSRERQELKAELDDYLHIWKEIGASGKNPALTFKGLENNRLSVLAEYSWDDTTASKMNAAPVWKTAVTMFDITDRLSDIFDRAAQLGYDLMLWVEVQAPYSKSVSISNYTNATLRRVVSFNNAISTFIYFDALEVCQNAPFLLEDSIMCTGASYCDGIWTMYLHSSIESDTEEDGHLFWMLYSSSIVSDMEFMHYIGMDSSMARISVTRDWANDTLVFEYTPEQLLGKEPVIDINRAGILLAKSINNTLPMPLQGNMGMMEACTYDSLLHVLAVDCVVEELTVLYNQGKETELRWSILAQMQESPEAKEFLNVLVAVGLGIEYRMQSRTTRRPLTVTIMPEELRVYMLMQD